MDIYEHVQELIRLANERYNAEVRAFLSPFAGRETDGGCEECDAHQEVTLDDAGPNRHRIDTVHCMDCPVVLQAQDQFQSTLAEIQSLPEAGAL